MFRRVGEFAYHLGIVAAMTMVLAGCGSGGTIYPAKPLAVPGTEMEPPDNDVDSPVVPTVANIRQYKVAEAARNVPRAGSVTQSSNADSDRVTLDSADIQVSAVDEQLSYVVTYNGLELVSTESGTATTGVADVRDRSKGTHLYERVDGGIQFYRSLDQVEVEFGKHGAIPESWNPKPGDFWVDVYTDFQAAGSADADYLAGGILVYAPDDATHLTDYQYAAFVDGNDPFVQDSLPGLKGTATYVGEDSATGLYANAREQRNYFFDADVTLTANFGYGGELGWVEGRIHDFEMEGTAVSGDPQLALRNTNIGRSESGFFNGDTSMTFEGSTFTGKWGGQFYSNGVSPSDAPGSVAGTFGAATDDASESFLGSFGAYRAGEPTVADERVTIDLTSYLTGSVGEGKSPGLFAAVIDGEGVRAIGASGVRKQGSSEEVTVKDLVHLGSLTKAMTSTMLATLVEDGTFPDGWETTIADVFPELVDEIDEDYHSVHLSQLVRMKGGIARDAADWWSYYGNPDVVRKRYALVRDNLMESSAGSTGQFLYSNLSYMVAGAMAEKLTGKRWETLMEERIFTPLGITTAGFGAPGIPGGVDQPWGHRRDEGGAWAPNQWGNSAALGPAGTVHLSIEDWAKFIELWFADESPAVLNRSTLNELMTPDSGNYAAGWVVGQEGWAGGVALSHTGTNLSWYATLWVAPNRNFAVLAVANGVENDLNGTHSTLDAIVSSLIVNEAPAASGRMTGGGGILNLNSPKADLEMIDAANADADVSAKAVAAVVAAARSESFVMSGSHISLGVGEPARVQAAYDVDGPTVSILDYAEVGDSKRTSRGHQAVN